MLGLRAQRLKEEEAKAAEMQGMISSITGGLGKLAGGFEQAGKDKAANALMQEYFGPTTGGPQGIQRAQAVDPALQGPADIAAAKLPGYFRGGEAELGKRIELEKMKDVIQKGKAEDIYKKAAERRAESYLGLARDKAADVNLRAKQAAADAILNKLEPASKEIYTASQAYQVKSAANQAQFEKAINDGDRAAFEAAARDQHALNSLHAAKKLSVDQVGVPQWLSPEDREAVAMVRSGGRGQIPQGTRLSDFQGPSTRSQRVGLTAADMSTGAYNRFSIGPQGGEQQPAPSNYQYVPPEAVNRAMSGAQVSPQEFQQIVGQPAPQAGPAPQARPAAAPGAAPGVSLPIIRGPGGQQFRWDYQLGKPVPVTTQ